MCPLSIRLVYLSIEPLLGLSIDPLLGPSAGRTVLRYAPSAGTLIRCPVGRYGDPSSSRSVSPSSGRPFDRTVCRSINCEARRSCLSRTRRQDFNGEIAVVESPLAVPYPVQNDGDRELDCSPSACRLSVRSVYLSTDSLRGPSAGRTVRQCVPSVGTLIRSPGGRYGDPSSGRSVGPSFGLSSDRFVDRSAVRPLARASAAHDNRTSTGR